MLFKPLDIKGAFLISSPIHPDNRGHFTRLFCKEELEKNSLNSDLIQASLSYNKKKGTLRGMHFQEAPYEEDKMVRCIQGAVFDVIADLRPKSPTFLKWIGVELSEKNNEMIYIPKGLAHGFQSLEDDSILIYFMTEKFNPEASSGFFYDDPKLKIKWPIKEKIISEKDQGLPNFLY
jgi:dTDP-4-dehydrorhamnose 3,5-epimerase